MLFFSRERHHHVNVVLGSFLVSAKDKSGDPVTMVIGPNSMLMLTQAASSKNATTGSAAATEGPSRASQSRRAQDGRNRESAQSGRWGDYA
jgi:hypothetical protein